MEENKNLQDSWSFSTDNEEDSQLDLPELPDIPSPPILMQELPDIKRIPTIPPLIPDLPPFPLDYKNDLPIKRVYLSDLPPPIPPKPIRIAGVKSIINYFEKLGEEINEDLEEFEENHQDEIAEYSTMYSCTQCTQTFRDEISLNDHFLLVHHQSDNSDSETEYSDSDSESDADGICTCRRCGKLFQNDDEYEKHICDANRKDVDAIPSNPFGKYSCPICKKKYSTNNILGEHFIRAHNNYEALTELDSRETDYGFPGFDILEQIGFIDIPKDGKINVRFNSDKICSVCYGHYKNKTDSADIISENKIISGYVSDSAINTIKRFIIRRQYNKYIGDDYEDECDEYLVDDEQLLEFFERYDQKVNLPVFMSCCSASICKPCLESYVRMCNKLVCPYCKKDGEREDLDFILIVEPTKYNKEIWINWWKKHLDNLF